MAQAALIDRLKKVEEALENGVESIENLAAAYHDNMRGYRPDIHAAYDQEVEAANAALADLRDLIKEAEALREAATILDHEHGTAGDAGLAIRTMAQREGK